VLAIFVADAPTEMLKIFDQAAKEVVLHSFPGKLAIRLRITIRTLHRIRKHSDRDPRAHQ
jgi:hypothetical protein